MSDRTPDHKRGGSGLAAMAIVIGAVFVWWLFSGNGPSGPDGNDPRLAVPDVDASQGPDSAEPTGPQPIDEDAVRIEGFVDEDGRVALNYTSPPPCAGALDTPRVLETDAAVTITLFLVPPEEPPADCADGTEEHTVRVLLDSPLNGRAILDGSVSPQVRVAPDEAPYE